MKLIAFRNAEDALAHIHIGMPVGFTGSREGMTAGQKLRVDALLKVLYMPLNGQEFHHGDDRGADCEAGKMANMNGYRVVIHPPTNPARRGYGKHWKEEPVYSYLVRNHHIVDATHVMIATPSTAVEMLRSGTWATVRYARKSGTDVIIIDPRGNMYLETQRG